MKPLPFEKVTIVMGSRSDWSTMSNATRPLEELGISFATAVVSAHRTPQRLVDFASRAHESGTRVIIAGAGGSAHLPGMIAAISPLPVIAVPIESRFMTGMDSLLSIVQMPRGVAVATQAVGVSGAYNAGLMAAQMLSLCDDELQQRLIAWRERQTEQVPITVE
ncbi:5-(carboxyamino)imidazole ribonucleotide mutase [Microbulbifer sp. OS29]|uniref:N5-carboxyaminoimidazole ribonucleotide mutase n=1 Tax=Microbulbifer okhotskensis TaxID=2926617 RepID=A0A9X2EPJ4_9GAMM|nr:5-(carboxyamino)imidazole ribonucleotide mutase [Microbulbifer okhotskensis]MCO1335439.1 5-(carboxyamino)imidazole ribonucleotide mutase [Microbulbifer okhotskensis]